MAYYVMKETDLKELNELRLSDFGVVQKDSGAAMKPNSRILVIGLGGMGLRTVFELKSAMGARIGKISDTSTDIRFLAIDTDNDDINKYQSTGILSAKETFHLFNEKLGAVMALPENLVPASIKTILPPKSKSFNPVLEGAGAGQVRLAGRLSLMDPDIFQKLCTRIKDAITGLGEFASKTLEVHIIAGVGGGSGSGLCIDIPYLVRSILKELGVSPVKTKLFGHIYLPNVYNDGGTASISNAYGNGYAALKEIDYYMNIESIGETYDAVYPNGSFSSGSKIFTNCTLIGGKLSESIVIANPKAAAIECCVENLINQVTSAVGKDKDGKPSSVADLFTSKGFLDNVATGLKNMIASHGEANFHPGGSYRYLCIGSSTLKFPNNAIIEKFVGEAYTRMLERMKRNADSITQKDVDDYAKGLLAPDDLIKPVIARLSAYIDELFGEQKWTKALIGNTFDLFKAIDSRIDKIVAEFDADGQTIAKAITSANNKADTIFRDPDKGPLFLALLLSSQSKSGGKVMGYYEMLTTYAASIDKRRREAQDNLDNDTARKNELSREIPKKLFLTQSQIENFQEVLRNIFINKLEVKICEKLAVGYYLPFDNIDGACYKMKKSLDDYYLYYVDIISRIGTIVADNARECSVEIDEDTEGKATLPNGSIFALKDDCFNPLKSGVRAVIKRNLDKFDETAVKNFAGALAATILDHRDDWMLDDSVGRTAGASKCAAAFRAFIKGYPAFETILNRTFSDYFDEAYGDKSEVEQKKIISQLVSHLKATSSPMFNVWPAFGWASIQTLCFEYMIIPNNMGDHWGTMFKDCLGIDGTMNRNIFESPDQSAIYNYTMYAGMPIWLHADLITYEEKYNQLIATTAGMHINEHPSFLPAYTEYPTLMPSQQWYRAKSGSLEYSNAREVEKLNEVRKIVDFCVENGIIHNTGSGYVVSVIANKPDEEALKKFLGKYCDERTGPDGIVPVGATLYNALLEAFGTKDIIIATIGNGLLQPVEIENVYELVRVQMKLFGTLRDEMNYLTAEGSVLSIITEINQSMIGGIKRAEFFRYMYCGFVGPDAKGVWSYRLAGQPYRITSNSEVAFGTSAYLKDYMELAAFIAFDALENIDLHRPKLSAQIRDLSIAFENDEVDKALLSENYATFMAKADKVLDELDLHERRGNRLTAQQEEIRAFYEQLKKVFNDINAMFGA